MSSGSCTTMERKFKGVRRRKWGKWVSEIRVPGSQERLWLGTYASPEAAAVAHDVAFYCLRRPSSMEKLNFPAMLPSYCVQHYRDMSPRSVQKGASDAGMAVDAQRIVGKPLTMVTDNQAYENERSEADRIHIREPVSVDSVELEFSPTMKNPNLNSSQNQKNIHRRVCEEDHSDDGFWWGGGGDDGGTWDHREGEGLSISIEDYMYQFRS